MLRYDRSDRRPPNYLARREQWRVFRLVIALGLVIILLDQLRRPRAVEILGIFFGAQDQAVEPALLDRQDDLGRLGQDPAIAADHDLLPAGAVANAALAAPPVGRLDAVRDNTPFRKPEFEPWYQLLGILHDALPQQLRKATAGELTALQLKEQPSAYRGRLVTVSGTARQSIPIDPFAAEFAPRALLPWYLAPELTSPAVAVSAYLKENYLNDYHRVVLQQPGASNPVVVFTLNVPEGFPSGEPIRESVSVTGYFFKNWLYASGDQLTVAPVLLAKQIEWQPVASEAPPVQGPGSRDILFTLAAAAGVSAIITCWLWRRNS